MGYLGPSQCGRGAATSERWVPIGPVVKAAMEAPQIGVRRLEVQRLHLAEGAEVEARDLAEEIAAVVVWEGVPSTQN